MLYNLMPPTILLLSLGGIMVILSRGVSRMRKAQFAASVKSYGADVSQTAAASSKNIARVLRPTHKGVQAISNRAAALALSLKTGSQELVSETKHLGSRISKWRGRQATPAAEPVPAKEASTPAASPSASPKKGQLVIPSSGWREKFTSSVSGAVQSARTHTHQSLTKLKRARMQSNPLPATSPVSATPPAASPVASIKTKIVKPAPVPKPSPVSAHRSILSFTKPAPVSVTTPTAAPVPSTPLEQAQAALNSGDFKKAEFFVLNHITKHTKDIDAYLLLGQISLAQSNWNEALEIFEQVASWDPQHPGAYAGLGYAACRAGKLTRAIQALQRAHEVEPENVAVLQDLYIIARRMDNPALQHSIAKKLEALNASVVASHAEVVSA